MRPKAPAGQARRANTHGLLSAASGNGGQQWAVIASAESLGGTGYRGKPISASGYSELSVDPNNYTGPGGFAALGNLPDQTQLRITNPANGKSTLAKKQDVGAGSSFLPVMGIYPGTAAELGLSGGEFHVIIERTDGGPLKPARGRPASGGVGGITPGGAGANPSTGSGPLATGSSGGGGGTFTNVLGAPVDIGGGGGGGILGAITGTIGDAVKAIAPVFGSMISIMVKDAFVGFGDFVIIPLWHWNQRAVDTYWNQILDLKTTNEKYKLALPWTALFWGSSYIIFFTDPNAGDLKPVPPARTHAAKHTRRLQASPARAKLIKPKHVKEKTPKKPKEIVSQTPVNQTGTLHTRRSRPVKVIDANRTQLGNEPSTPVPTTTTTNDERNSETTVTHTSDRARSAPRDGSGSHPEATPVERPGHGSDTGRRGVSVEEHKRSPSRR